MRYLGNSAFFIFWVSELLKTNTQQDQQHQQQLQQQLSATPQAINPPPERSSFRNYQKQNFDEKGGDINTTVPVINDPSATGAQYINRPN